MTNRLYVASMNNVKAAQPQHGLSQADLYFEMLVEGSATRCLGVFSNISAVEKLGSMRSARFYTLSLARCFDAILVRAGGSNEADQAIARLGWDEVDGIKGNAGNAFYRDQARKKAGYAYEHTLFTSGSAVIENAEKRGLRTTREQPYDFGWQFAANATPLGDSAHTVTLAFGSGNKAKTTTMTYDQELGKYQASQYGKPWIDGNTGETTAFENVLILHANTFVQTDGIHKTIELIAEGDGYFANGGRITPIRWSRSAEEAPFVFTLTDGTPLSLGVGNSYIGIIPLLGTVTYEAATDVAAVG